MKKILAHTAAVAMFSLAAVAAQAGVNLPTSTEATAIRFDGGLTVFDLTVDPTYNANTNEVLLGGGNLMAFGDVINVVNHATSAPGPGSPDRGSIDPTTQLTFALTGSLTNIHIPSVTTTVAGAKKVHIDADLMGLDQRTGPSLTLFEKDLNLGSGLNTQSLIGKSTAAVATNAAAVLATASANSTVYLDFSDIQGASVSIDVLFEKTAGSSTFNKRTVTYSFFADFFPVTGGSAAGLFSEAEYVRGIQGPKYVTTVAKGATVGNDDHWIEANTALVVDRTVPEPASLAMVGLGALLIGYRGRREHTNA
ncbi:MAG: PEP-CTERM sorting domain-containing protein [Planctomycetota bacterium]|nr:PEP-CTERM sorting domain-containing protein [Planctomycetota bacterium]